MDLLLAFKKHLELKNIESKEVGSILIFQFENWTYVFLYDKEDPYYFRLSIPRISSVNTNDGNELFHKALVLSGEYKVAKAIIVGDEIWLIFEMFLNDYDFKNTRVFDRAITILDRFAEELQQKSVNQEH